MSIKVKNVSPFGELDVPLLGCIVGPGEVVEVTDEQAALLLIQPFHYAPGDKKAEDFLASLGWKSVADAGNKGAEGIEVLKSAAASAAEPTSGEGEPA